jgi:hypothetical protein
LVMWVNAFDDWHTRAQDRDAWRAVTKDIEL